MQTDRRRPFCRPSWLSFVGQNPYSKLEREFDGSNPYMKLEEIQVRVTTTCKLIGGGHFVAYILVIVCGTKPKLEFERELD